MAITPEQKTQLEVLTTNTSNNEEMKYNQIPLLNKGLDSKYFPKSMSRVVNAINASMDRAESARQYGADLYKKFANIILDPAGSYGKDKLEEMIEKTGEDTLIEAICEICDRLSTGEGVNVTYETIVNALGYVPAVEAGANYVVGIFLD